MLFEVGETLVYPHHGAATITAVKNRKVKGDDKKYITLSVHQSELTIELPVENAELVGLRDVIDKDGVEAVYDVLRGEVEEETGIQGRVLTTLGTIDYWFSTHDRRIHKVVHHYLLEAIGGYLTVEKDPDQEAIDVAWIPLGRVQERLTFPNERRIAQLAWERLAGEG